jgi:hypothetical protein
MPVSQNQYYKARKVKGKKGKKSVKKALATTKSGFDKKKLG